MQQNVPKQTNKGGSPTNDSSANPLHETERTVRDWCQTARAEEIGREGMRREVAEIQGPPGDDYPSSGRTDRNGKRLISEKEYYRQDLVEVRGEIRQLERWIRDHPPLHMVNRAVNVKEVQCRWKRWPNIMWRCAREGCNGHTGDAVKDQYGDKVNFDNRGFFCSECEDLEYAKLHKLGRKFRKYRRLMYPRETDDNFEWMTDEWMKYGFDYAEGKDTSHIRAALNEDYVPTVQICELQTSARKPIPPSTGEDTSSGEDEKYNFTQQSRRRRRRKERLRKEKESAGALAATDSEPVGRRNDGVVCGRTNDGCDSARPIPPPPPPPLLRPKEQLVTCIDPKKTKKRKYKRKK